MTQINIPPDDDERRHFSVPAFSQNLGVIAVLVLLIATSFTMFYKINPEEVGVIQRFGKYVRTTKPGLHLKLPFGIETCIKVKKERVFAEEFGFRTKKAGIKTIYYSGTEQSVMNSFRYDSYSRKLGFSQNPFLAESLMLTGDLNCAEVEWAVFYKVKDPVQFCFNVRDVDAAIRDASESAMRQVVGDATIDEIITSGKTELQEKARKILQGILDSYDVGVDIVDLVLQDVNPPAEVKESFNEVNKAMQEKERITNQARAEYNRIIPKMKGEAERMVSEAEGYALNRVNRAKGDADRFVETWNAYKEAKNVTKRRLYLETMLDLLPQTEKKVIIDSDVQGMLPFYNLTTGEKKGGAA